MDFWYVDRIEGDTAVCERPDGTFQAIPLASLPHGAGEGSALFLEKDGSFLLCMEQESERKKRLFLLQEDLFDK